MESLSKTSYLEEDTVDSDHAKEAFTIIINHISTMDHVTDDLLYVINRICTIQYWSSSLYNLSKMDPLKRLYNSSFWVDVEFGVYADLRCGEILDISKSVIPLLREIVQDELIYLERIFPGFMKNPFNLFAVSNGCYDDVLPMLDPEQSHVWNKERMVARYYYHPNSMSLLPGNGSNVDWRSMLRKWKQVWSTVYGMSCPMAYITNYADKTRQEVEGYKGVYNTWNHNTDVNMYAFVASVKLYNGETYMMGHSLFRSHENDS